jgi:hypothetical protein
MSDNHDTIAEVTLDNLIAESRNPSRELPEGFAVCHPSVVLTDLFESYLIEKGVMNLETRFFGHLSPQVVTPKTGRINAILTTSATR